MIWGFSVSYQGYRKAFPCTCWACYYYIWQLRHEKFAIYFGIHSFRLVSSTMTSIYDLRYLSSLHMRTCSLCHLREVRALSVRHLILLCTNFIGGQAKTSSDFASDFAWACLREESWSESLIENINTIKGFFGSLREWDQTCGIHNSSST